MAAIPLQRKQRCRFRAHTCVASLRKFRMIVMRVAVPAVAAMSWRGNTSPRKWRLLACCREPVMGAGSNPLTWLVCIQRSPTRGHSRGMVNLWSSSSGIRSSLAAVCKRIVLNVQTPNSCSSVTVSRRRNLTGMTTRMLMSRARCCS